MNNTGRTAPGGTPLPDPGRPEETGGSQVHSLLLNLPSLPTHKVEGNNERTCPPMMCIYIYIYDVYTHIYKEKHLIIN